MVRWFFAALLACWLMCAAGVAMVAAEDGERTDDRQGQYERI